MPNKKCKICHKTFHIKLCHLKMGYGIYCSRSCSDMGRKKGKFVLCDICGKEIWKRPKALKNSKSKKFFCGKSCQTKWRNKEFSGVKHPNWKGGEFTYGRIMKELGIKPICSHCGINNKQVLVIHHLDQNRKNNTHKNLIWLCRNCHYLIHQGHTI